jgi:hypothetical protein
MRHSRFISSTPLIAGLLTGLLFAILVYVPPSSSDSFFWETYNTPGMMWGDSPTYSAKIVAVSF